LHKTQMGWGGGKVTHLSAKSHPM